MMQIRMGGGAILANENLSGLLVDKGHVGDERSLTLWRSFWDGGGFVLSLRCCVDDSYNLLFNI